MINKVDFIKFYAKHNEISKTQSRGEVERFLDTIVEATAVEGGVTFPGYFKTDVVTVPARERMNPSTGTKMKPCIRMQNSIEGE